LVKKAVTLKQQRDSQMLSIPEIIETYANIKDEDGDDCIEYNGWRLGILPKSVDDPEAITDETDDFWLYVSEISNKRYKNILIDDCQPRYQLKFLYGNPAVRVEFAHFVTNKDMTYKVIAALFPNLNLESSDDVVSRPQDKSAATVTLPIIDAANEACEVCGAVYYNNVRVAKFSNRVRCWQHCY